METFEGAKTFYARSRAEWRKWLAKNSEIEKKVCLIVYHRKSKIPCVGFQEAIEEAICFGWIDSKGKRRGPDSYYWCFNKRNPKSTWGKASRERANRMIRDGLMTSQGLDMIELAKRSGTWEAHLDAENLVIPSDLKRQIEKNKKARENFESFAPSSKRIVLQWIEDAKRLETRQRRIKQAVELAEENQIAGLPMGLRENRSRRRSHLVDPGSLTK